MKKILQVLLVLTLLVSVIPVHAESAETTSVIEIKGVFVGELSAQLKEETAEIADFQGYSDCIVVFDYINDDTNRRLPEHKGGYSTQEVTLSIGGKNTYNAYVPQYKRCDYINTVTRYAGYANPIGYGNLLGGADPVRMYALFFINPNDIASGAEMVITVGDQTGIYSTDNVQTISIPDEILKAEADYEVAQQVTAFKWRMDKAFNDAVSVVNAKGGFGSDYNGMSKAMLNIFNEDASWGISMIDMPSGGFSNIDGIYFEKVLSDATKPLDLSVVKAAYPEVAPLIQFYANTTTELGAAIANSKTTTNSINELLSDNLNAYFDLCEFFGLQNLAEYQMDNGTASKLTSFIKYWDSNNFRKHVVITFSDKDTVQKVQQALNDAGYNCGTPDGVAGKKTAAAIEQYQESKGLQKTGTITVELLVAMGIEIPG